MDKPMRRGWIAVLDDGTEMWENEFSWKEVPKAKIKKLVLIFEGRKWEISDKVSYIQRKRGSISPGEQEPVIESRIIGYYEDNYKVEYILDEQTGTMHIHAIEV